MTEATAIRESCNALYTAYAEFVENLDGDPRAITGFLPEGADTKYIFVKDLQVPRQINVSSAQYQLSNSRYKRLIGALNSCVTLINTSVDRAGEGILEKLPEYLLYYHQVHTIYLLSLSLIHI